MSTGEIDLKYFWDEAHFSPNPNQERAIRHLDGPLYLPAGPGSGKTRVLLWRTVNLMVFHDVKPEEILLDQNRDLEFIGTHYDDLGKPIGPNYPMIFHFEIEKKSQA